MSRFSRRFSGFDLADQAFTTGGITYFNTMPGLSMVPKKVDKPDGTFEQMVAKVHGTHGVIVAAVIARGLLLSELTFKWRNVTTGNLFGTTDLGVLEKPNDQQTIQELLMVAEQHVSYAGNAFFHRDGDQIRLLNPGWVKIMLGSNSQPDEADFATDAKVIGYMYQPGGEHSSFEPHILPPDEVAHWRPEPDPVSWWRGRSWVQSILTEWATDRAAWTHTQAFFENAATPQMVFTMDPGITPAQLKEFAKITNEAHAGAGQAYKNLFVGGGADAKVVGVDLARLDLKNLQGLTETRIAVRARIPAAILGVSEGLQGSALNGSSYNQTRRTLADTWFTPTAKGLCAVLEQIVPPTGPARLSFDPSLILFLQDDQLDAANIRQADSVTMQNLIREGFDPDSVVAAVTNGDMSLLVHSGLVSIQLQSPGSLKLPTPSQDPDVTTVPSETGVTP